MLARIFRILIIVLSPTFALGQSLDLSVSDQTSGNDASTFLLEKGKISVGSETIQFLDSGSTVSGVKSFGISPDRSMVSLLKWGGDEGEIMMLNSEGDILNSYSTINLADETSFGVYPFNNGGQLLRDKIANFTFYDTFGEIVTNMSSSSQSKEGEAISEVAVSPGGQTIVIYNPKIKRNGNLGSKAQVMTADGSFKNMYFESDRYLKDVTVSRDGNIVVFISAGEGPDRVLIMDKYGNELNSIAADENLIGASLTDNSEYITLYSGGRVMVFSILEGESLGATSFRSTVFLADYFPDDNLILALTGSYSESTGVMTGAEFRAIDLKRRAIKSEGFRGSLGFNPAISPRLVRVSAGRYRLEGGSKQIEIEANF